MRIILVTSSLNLLVAKFLNEFEVVGVVRSRPRHKLVTFQNFESILKQIISRLFFRETLRTFCKKNLIPFFELKTNNLKFYNWVRNLNPDVIFVYSMSQLIREQVLTIPSRGVLNLHPSLLPDWRGPNPVQWQYLTNAHVSGYTLHYLDEMEDSGPIVYQNKFMIPRGLPVSNFESEYAIRYGFPLIRRAICELEQNRELNQAPQPKKSKTIRARRLRLMEIYQLINWSEWDIERIWHCVSGMPEVVNLISCESHRHIFKQWKVYNYSIKETSRIIPLPKIITDNKKHYIEVTKGYIEIQ